MTRDEALREVLTREPDFLARAPRDVNGAPTYICPECGNGSGQDGDGIALDINSKDQQHKHWKCFKCGLYMDIVELWERANHYSSQGEAMKALYEHYGLNVESSRREEGPTQGPAGSDTDTDRPDQKDTAAYLAWTAQQIGRSDYCQKRGISLKTCRQFGIGYDPTRYIDYDQQNNTWTTAPAVVIPRGGQEYTLRLTDRDGPGSKRKSKGKFTHFFNGKALYESTRPVFVTEGEFDALSIIEAGGAALALGGTEYAGLLVDALKAKRPAQPLILALDNDSAGQAAKTLLLEQVPGLVFGDIPLFEGCKDANEYLKLYGLEVMRGEIIKAEAAVKEAQKEQREKETEAYKATSAGGLLPAFVTGIGIETPVIPTGFTALDNILDGGLYEGLYVIGAISSLGKTALVMQIADQIAAQQGQDVLVFSLEMSRYELMARSISRHTVLTVLDSDPQYYNMNHAKTGRGITATKRYRNYSERDKTVIRRAIEAYDKYAQHIYISEGIGDLNAQNVRGTIEKHIDFIGCRPVVVVDYVQILAPWNEKLTDKQNMDRNVLELKRTSRDLKIPVIAISSFNRDNYNSPASMIAFKESGAIEYSSDVLIGLQLEGVGQKGFDVDTAKAKNPREVELKVLKNRAGATGKTIKYKYYPAFNYFVEVEA